MKIAIATNFTEIRPGYSLSGIVTDQAITLQRYGHEVTILTCEKFYHDKSELPANWSLDIRPTFPYSKLIDYRKEADISEEHLQFADILYDVLCNAIEDFDVVFTHDWVFTGWNLPYAKALLKTQGMKQKFLHWIHSIPSGRRDWWCADRYGANHKIAYPNVTDRLHVSQQFRTKEQKIVVVPHIKDLRTFCDFQQDTCDFLHEHPELMTSPVTQIYPASTDRLTAKRLREVILLFSKLKERGFPVCLVVANQHATGRQRKEDINLYKTIARRNGLQVDVDLVFTSDFQDGKWEKGVPRKILSELMQLGNIFFFPTREEAFGLVLPEAVLMGGCLPIVNKSLRQQLEVSGYHGLLVDLGSWDQPLDIGDENGYFNFIADLVIARMIEDDSLQAKTHFRVTYNMDTIYQRYYEPILTGSVLWT